MGLLHLAAVLALAVIAFAADCGTTKFLVDGNLQKNFNVGPNSKCVYAFSWRANTGAYIAAHADGIYSDNTLASPYTTVVSMYNEFVGGNNMTFGYQSDGLFLNETNTYWAPGTVKLAISTGPTSNVAIRIAVSISSTTKDAIVETAQVVTGSQPIVVSDSMQYGKTYVYTSTSKIVMAVTSVTDYFTGNGTYFDSVFVYDGQGPNAVLLGSLGQLSRTSAPQAVFLQSNYLTLLPLSQAKLEGKIVINNQQNTAAFGYNQLYMFSHKDHSHQNAFVVFSSDYVGGAGTDSILSFGGNQPDYPIITKINFSDNTAVLQVFSGLPTNKMTANYIKQFNAASVANMAPQPFPGTAITFTINRGYAYVYYTSALTPDVRM